jgi:hypothetical protein
MRRREFIAGLGSAGTWPAVVRAQQGDLNRRIGVLTPWEEGDEPYPKVSLSTALTAGRASAPSLWPFVVVGGGRAQRPFSQSRSKLFFGTLGAACPWNYSGGCR